MFILSLKIWAHVAKVWQSLVAPPNFTLGQLGDETCHIISVNGNQHILHSLNFEKF